MITNVEAVTVFNGRTDKETRRTKYIPTVIRGVSYQESKGSTVTNSGVWSNDVQYKFRIPLNAETGGRSYLPEREYAQLDDEQAAEHWTIRKSDIVVMGEYTGESVVLFEDVLQQYAKEHGLDQIKVTEYADNTSGGSAYLKHWRIGGK